MAEAAWRASLSASPELDHGRSALFVMGAPNLAASVTGGGGGKGGGGKGGAGAKKK